MGMFDFIKNAGEKIFKPGEAKKEAAIKQHLGSYGNDYNGIDVEVDGNKAVLTGQVGSMAVREKAVLIAGNIDGIERDDDIEIGGAIDQALIAIMCQGGFGQQLMVAAGGQCTPDLIASRATATGCGPTQIQGITADYGRYLKV